MAYSLESSQRTIGLTKKADAIYVFCLALEAQYYLPSELLKAGLLMRKACLNWTASEWGCVRPMHAYARAQSPNNRWALLWGGEKRGEEVKIHPHVTCDAFQTLRQAWSVPFGFLHSPHALGHAPGQGKPRVGPQEVPPKVTAGRSVNMAQLKKSVFGWVKFAMRMWRFSH
jgi:hypothetical protein